MTRSIRLSTALLLLLHGGPGFMLENVSVAPATVAGALPLRGEALERAMAALPHLAQHHHGAREMGQGLDPKPVRLLVYDDDTVETTIAAAEVIQGFGPVEPLRQAAPAPSRGV